MGSIINKTLRGYERMVQSRTGTKVVRPFNKDGYVNVVNKYGTSRDTTEHYQYTQEPPVPDDLLASYYEGNGLFAKIIDAPAEEAVKHGFKLGISDQKLEDFYTDALDELDWDETVMTAIKWARLFGGSIIVMLIDDGRGLDEPLDWKNIRSIDDLRVYDRSVIQEDTSGMFNYNPDDPFRTRASRLGMPEYYDVFSKYGNFRVHDSRCLVFQNGILPENTTNSTYQLWGVPEYIRLNRAIRDTEVAHGSAVKLLDRSVQAVYKMQNLASELATEEGEQRVLRRLQAIDLARGLLNSITIDAEGEDYDFKSFQFSGVSDVIDTTCNYLSALTNIPQTVLFGRSPAGMNSTGESDLENWYSYVERIQSRMVRKNLRYLLSILFQAGVACGEVDEVPPIKIEFNSLWSMSESEKANLDQLRAQTQQVKAQTAQIYMDQQVIDPSEVRKKLAASDEFDIETMLDDYDDDDDDLFAGFAEQNAMSEAAEPKEQIGGETQEAPKIIESGAFDAYANLDSNSDDDSGWITLENGNRVKIEEGTVVSGASGNLNGQSLSSANSQPLSELRSSSEWQSTVSSQREEHLSMKANKKAVALTRAYGVTTQDPLGKEILTAFKANDGSLDQMVNDYYDLLEENGDTSAVGETRDQASSQLADDVDSGKYGSYTEARTAYIQDYTGCDEQTAQQTLNEMTQWFSGSGSQADTEVLDSYIDSAGAYDGVIQRGMSFTDDASYEQAMSSLRESGSVFSSNSGKNQSWTSDAETARRFAHMGDDDTSSIQITCLKNRTSTPVSHLSTQGESEVMSHSKAQWTVLNTVEWTTSSGAKKAQVYVIEKEARKDSRRADRKHRKKHGIRKDDSSAATAAVPVNGSVAVLVVSDGCILTGVRNTHFGHGLICGPGGHVEEDETHEEAAIRETYEEFGTIPKDLMLLGYGPYEPDTGLKPAIYLATEVVGKLHSVDGEMSDIRFRSLAELAELDKLTFQPFRDSLSLLLKAVGSEEDTS